ncbi:unnamed protein product [Rhizophagus irregularis]|nr:unnamed protein product [Rhizophagus irregularis]
MINNNIDLVDRYIEADINDTLLIKEFIEKFSMHKDLSVNLKVDIMKESFEWENKKKLPSSYRLKLDIFSPDVLDDKLKNLRFEINIREIDVTKAQIHGIIILLIIIASSTSINIEIKKSLIWILENFQGEDSDLKWKELTKKCDSDVIEQNELHNSTDNRADEYLKFSLKDVFYQNELQEINWKRTFDFLKKGTSFKTLYTSNEDNSLRCEKEPETWEHIWICENNDMTEYDVFIKSMIEIEEEYKNGDNKDLAKFKALRILNAGLALFMQDKSKVLILDSQIKVREITRGLFNNKLYDLTRNKIERQVVDEIWERSFLNIRKWLWLNRCNEVEVIEKTKGVSKTLKKRKRDPPIVVKSSSDAGNVIDLDNDIKNKKVKKMLK